MLSLTIIRRKLQYKKASLPCMFKKIKILQCRLRDRFPGQKPSCSIAQLDFDVWEDPTSVKTFAGQPDTKVRLPGQSFPSGFVQCTYRTKCKPFNLVTLSFSQGWGSELRTAERWTRCRQSPRWPRELEGQTAMLSCRELGWDTARTGMVPY